MAPIARTAGRQGIACDRIAARQERVSAGPQRREGELAQPVGLVELACRRSLVSSSRRPSRAPGARVQGPPARAGPAASACRAFSRSVPDPRLLAKVQRVRPRRAARSEPPPRSRCARSAAASARVPAPPAPSPDAAHPDVSPTRPRTRAGRASRNRPQRTAQPEASACSQPRSSVSARQRRARLSYRSGDAA